MTRSHAWLAAAVAAVALGTAACSSSGGGSANPVPAGVGGVVPVQLPGLQKHTAIAPTTTIVPAAITADGKFLYGAERKTSSLVGFKIDPEKGTLTKIGRFDTEKTPRGFHIDPRSKFLLAVGMDSASMTVHSIDPNSGELKPGELLPSERDLMSQFGVGRPAIREALFALGRMGLVEVANGERPRVSNPTPKTLIGELAGAARLMLSKPEGVHHFQEARMLFESALAEEAARVAGRADMLALERALRVNRQAIGEPVRFQQTDVAFHLAIASIPRSRSAW